jgi:hypothetical protein
MSAPKPGGLAFNTIYSIIRLNAKINDLYLLIRVKSLDYERALKEK